MSLKGIAEETLNILERGSYQSPNGNCVQFPTELSNAISGTKLYEPSQLDTLLENDNATTGDTPLIEVTEETTQVAARRLVVEENCSDLVLLNFASARNPGGGFINGAKAQEEDLARCSGLYPCLLGKMKYYEINRQQQSLLYTDHIIYSPEVPWFRTKSRNLLDAVFLASVITAPAPNANQVLRGDPTSGPQIIEVLKRRAGMILSIARDNKHRNLLLGAWGCGVFGNNPEEVANAFKYWLSSPKFLGCFNRVVFAIYDSTKDKRIVSAFQLVLQGGNNDRKN